MNLNIVTVPVFLSLFGYNSLKDYIKHLLPFKTQLAIFALIQSGGLLSSHDRYSFHLVEEPHFLEHLTLNFLCLYDFSLLSPSKASNRKTV